MPADTATITDILDGFGRFLDAEISALHADNPWLGDPQAVYGPDGRYRKEVLDLFRQVRERSAAAGFYTMTLPEGVGGADIGFEGTYRAWEMVFQRCGTRLWLGLHALAHWTKGPSPLLLHADAAVRDAYLPDLASGRTSMCFAMSEPDAGSDSWMMRTTARRVAGGWQLSGGKQWISNGAHADLAVVFAVTDRAAAEARRGGVTAFLVPTDSPGFNVAGVDPMFGHPGSNEAVLYFDDVFVPDDHVLGGVDGGFSLAMQGVSLGRLYNCAKSVGLAAWALEMALDYVQHRTAFSVPLSSHQGLAFPIAESAIDIHGARLMSVNCARLLDAGQPARKELAMAKVFATERGLQVVDRAMQAHGAIGFTNDLGLAEAWQMIRVVCVADGSAEILRRQIANRLFEGDTVL